MSQTQMIPLVRDFDELQDRVKEAVREGGFYIQDFGIGPYECHGFRGTHHSYGLEYDGPTELLFIVLNPDEGDDGTICWTHRQEDHEAEMVASVTYIAPVLDAAFKVRVDVEQM